MDYFRTVFPAQQAPFQIGHKDQLLLLGSCFSEHIGARLAGRKFKTMVNPFGIVYNPVSIARCLRRLRARCPFEAAELTENMGLYHSWEHHGRFSTPDMEGTLLGINTAYEQAGQHLKDSNFLLLTLGTAEVFMLRQSGQIVANNHKMPSNLFEQKRLSVGEVTDALEPILAEISAEMPDLRIVLSVSPLRHLRNGMVENQRSKAVVLLACEEICRHCSNAFYFPAYELLLDDLRDYRFYAADMIHPSEVAVDYIWQYFSDMFFNAETQSLNTSIEKILAAARHRPFHEESAQHKAFAAAQLEIIRNVQEQHPLLDFSAEWHTFETIIKKPG